MASLKRITALSSCLIAILIVVSLWLHRRGVSDAKWIAIAMSTDHGPESGDTSESQGYSRDYQSGWLGEVAGSHIDRDGHIEPPAGESMNPGVRDGRKEAWRSLETINGLEARQRTRVFKAVHAYAIVEIKRRGIISAMKSAD
jgi:hypothetical protein